MTERPLRWILFVVVAGLSLVFLVDLCDLIYDCGCRSLWHGAARPCNIHRPRTPDCPWCSTGTWGLVVPAGAIVAGQALVLLAPGRARTSHRVLLAVALFPVVGVTGRDCAAPSLFATTLFRLSMRSTMSGFASFAISPTALLASPGLTPFSTRCLSSLS